MRITQQQIESLINSTHRCFGDNAIIWLFGSRVDDHKKGGDVDLYIETDMDQGIVEAKLKMQGQIWTAFGDQKIDILVHSRIREPSPMHKIAKSTGVRIQ
jgi:predicted nucleotidyltransferase